MTRKTKALGLALVAVAAMGTMAAAAQATQLHVNTPNTALLTGEQLVKLKYQITTSAAGPSVQCSSAHFEGTAEQLGQPQVTAQELTLTPQYTGCQFIGLAASTTMNGCKYTFTNAAPTAAKTMLVDITGCTAAAPRIEVHTPGCTLTFPEQHNLSHVTFAQNGTHVDMNLTLSGIKYETHGAACAHQPETTPRTDASVTGTVTLKGFVDNGSEVATHNGHQYNKGKAGAQVSLLVT
jgi:hypothetical protein